MRQRAPADVPTKPCNVAGDVIDFVCFCDKLVSGNVCALLMHLMHRDASAVHQQLSHP
jgi:hypothetical protein